MLLEQIIYKFRKAFNKEVFIVSGIFLLLRSLITLARVHIFFLLIDHAYMLPSSI